MDNKPLVPHTSNFSHHLYAALMYAYPADFRARFRREMTQIFEDSYPPANAVAEEIILFWLATLQDFVVSCPNAWWRELQETNESEQPSWMISIPVFVLATFVLIAEGWVGAALAQHLGRPTTPVESATFFRLNMFLSCALTSLSGALAVALANRKQIDLTILNCSTSSSKAA
jgi:hypothetical protein